MKQALDDLLRRMLEGTDLDPGQLLKAVLIIGLVFSFVHLLSMLVTRWGDSGASSKALVLSLLVHLTCVFGLIAASPAPNFVVEDPEQEVPDIQIRQLVMDSTDEPEHVESGNSPLWDRVPDPVEADPERAEVNPRDLPPIDDPTRTEHEADDAPQEFADASFRPDSLNDAPSPSDVPTDSPKRMQPELPELDDPTADRRAEVDSNPGPRRSDPTTVGGIDRELIRRAARTGGVPVPSPEFEAADERIAAIERPTPDSLIRPKGPVGSTIRQRSGPQPSPLDIDISFPTAEADPKEKTSGPGGTPVPERFASKNDRKRTGGIELGGGALDRVRTPDRLGIGRPQRLTVDDALARITPSGIAGDRLPTRIAPPSFGTAGPRRMTPVPPQIRRLDPEERAEVARRFGGTPESEKAVEDALRWLASVQHADGYWDADRFGAGQVKFETASNGERVDRDNAGRDADAGLTGLALLAFFAAGHTPYDGEYATTVERAIDWLAENQAESGYLGVRARYYAQTYSHAIATFALGEALGVMRDYDATGEDTARIKEVVRRATAFIVSRQNPEDGGWRYRAYVKGQKSDTSIFGWQLMALKSAERSGIRIPPDTRSLMIQFLLDRSLGKEKGLAAYRPGERISSAMTAEAHFCKQQFGIKPTHPATAEAIAHLRANLPHRSEYNLYYWYYGTLAMFHHGGEAWEEWNGELRDLLIADQVTTGEFAGSWEPRSKWSPYGGRVYSTAMSTLCLESYYRFFRKPEATASRAGTR